MGIRAATKLAGPDALTGELKAGVIDLLYRLGDDELIMGHRNSEWTGLGPILEEDIAFSSMAQDEMGHAVAYYGLLHALGEPEPDKLAFERGPEAYRCCGLAALGASAFEGARDAAWADARNAEGNSELGTRNSELKAAEGQQHAERNAMKADGEGMGNAERGQGNAELGTRNLDLKAAEGQQHAERNTVRAEGEGMGNVKREQGNAKPANDESGRQATGRVGGDWAFSLVRHYLYDAAEHVRLAALIESSYGPLAGLARKLLAEEKYHLMHGRMWVSKLGQGTEESRSRLQGALDAALAYAVGMFEPTRFDAVLAEHGVCPTEAELCERWKAMVGGDLGEAGLKAAPWPAAIYGGRAGKHPPELAELLEGMQKVYRMAPGAPW